jgi:hypothetical protein
MLLSASQRALFALLFEFDMQLKEGSQGSILNGRQP